MNDPLTLRAEPPLPRATGEGLLPRLVTRLFFRAATVAENRRLADGLHLVTLEGPALRGAAWTPGDKLQLKTGAGLLTRTYTPIEWDPAAGRTRWLAHALAPGPGSEWVRRAAPGDLVSVMGPRRSLDLSGFDARRSVLVGDETAIGLAAAWRPAHAIFESGQRGAVQQVLDTLRLPATAIARQHLELHLDALANAMLCLAAPDTTFVLAGRARTLQHLLHALRSDGVDARRICTKAHWADGRMGLD